MSDEPGDRQTEERRLTDEEIAFAQAMRAVALRERDLSFEEAVHEYRRVEAEFVKFYGDVTWKIVETKRRVTEWLLVFAIRGKADFDFSRGLWREMLERGFSGIDVKFNMSGVYGRLCQREGAFHEGLAVIEPVLAELEGYLADPSLPQFTRAVCEYERPLLTSMRDELRAGILYRWPSDEGDENGEEDDSERAESEPL